MKVLLTSIAIVISSSAQANAFLQVPICDKSEKIHKLLSSKYKEVPFAEGSTMQDGSGKVTIFAHPKKKTFSVVVDGPNGTSCMVAAGFNIKPATAPKKDEQL